MSNIAIGLTGLGALFALFTEAWVLARTSEVPLLADESRIVMEQSPPNESRQ